MSPRRRDVLKGLGSAAALAAFGKLSAQASRSATAPAPNGESSQAPSFPRKADFDIESGYTYINAAYTHPMPRVATEAAQRYVEGRRALRAPGGRSSGAQPPRADPKALFAELINAKPTEIAYVPNTSTGENLVVNGLGLDRKFAGNVVTDWLHYDGALVHLLELKRQGLDVRVVRPTKEFRIDLKDLEKAVDRNTKLVEVSSTAMYNGFQHDLKAVCDLAHANGAYVYADIIHSAGAEPFDAKGSGVDFAACSSFKWLMGDFGLGFLYVLAACAPLYLGQRASITVPTWMPDLTVAGAVRLLAVFFLTLPIAIALCCWALTKAQAWRTRGGRVTGRAFALGPLLLLTQVAVPFVLVAFSMLVQPATEFRYWIAGAFATAPVVALVASRAAMPIRWIAPRSAWSRRA